MARTTSFTIDLPSLDGVHIVDRSTAKPVLMTIFSLVFFGLALAGAIIKFATAGDLNGLRALLMRDDVIGWVGTMFTVLAPPVWLAFRTVATWVKKRVGNEIVAAAPNAIFSDEMPALPTRALETARPRLVGREALSPTAALKEEAAALRDSMDAERPAVSDRGMVPASSIVGDAEPRIAGDALDAPREER